MKKCVNLQKWSAVTDSKTRHSPNRAVRLCGIFLMVLSVVLSLCPPAFAASNPCENGNHSYTKYYNNCIGQYCETDYCQRCARIGREHTCLYPLRFMTMGKTYAYSSPWSTATSKLLTETARHNVNVTGRVRNQFCELWLILDDGWYILADVVAFNFDYYAEEVVKNVTAWSLPSSEIGLLFTYFPGKKTYDMKQDELLGNTYAYGLYSSGVFLPERYTGEQIGNMMYGYASAAKGLSYSQATRYADQATEGEDPPEDKHCILLGHNYRKNGTWFYEVSGRYVGKTLAIKSVEVGKYVSSNTDQDIQGVNAVANRDTANTWEFFTVEAGSAGAVGFRSAANKNYLSARIDENEASAYIQAAFGQHYSGPQSWESFRIFEWGDILYIQSQANGKWVQASVNEADYPIKASGDAASTWERFRLELVNR